MSTHIKNLVIKIANHFKQNNLKLATVESCTGGGLGYWLTSIPGSSQWYERGFVTYSKTAKITMVNVNPKTIEQFGEVSEETAIEMVNGGLKNSLADYCISITGIAGPDGATAQKPLGTVWIGLGKRNQLIYARHFTLDGNREEIRIRSIESALEELREVTQSGY
jgi:nicotinamide-nucleotide amidase